MLRPSSTCPNWPIKFGSAKFGPGIWIRPLEASARSDAELVLSGLRFGKQKGRARELAYDPTIPEAQVEVLAKVKQGVDWGFELLKHDFSTYDLLGSWGFEMGAEPTNPGLSFHDQSRTNAEIVVDLHQRIRESYDKGTLILRCNTIGHLRSGMFRYPAHWIRYQR